MKWVLGVIFLVVVIIAVSPFMDDSRYNGRGY